MKKAFKEEFKEMWADEPYQEPYQKHSLKEIFSPKKVLESLINIVRFELLYPKTKEIYDFGGMTADYEKGWVPSIILNTITAAYIGAQMNPEKAIQYGGLAFVFTSFIQPFLGSGVKQGIKSISEKYCSK
jgi:hypothetical protein